MSSEDTEQNNLYIRYVNLPRNSALELAIRLYTSALTEASTSKGANLTFLYGGSGFANVG